MTCRSAGSCQSRGYHRESTCINEDLSLSRGRRRGDGGLPSVVGALLHDAREVEPAERPVVCRAGLPGHPDGFLRMRAVVLQHAAALRVALLRDRVLARRNA